MRRGFSLALALLACGGESDGPLVNVPAGSFTMGCNMAADPTCESDELPAHDVVVSAFQIDRYEVTQARYQSCVDDGGCTAPDSDFHPDATPNVPVTFVTWEQASAYCAWAGRRLPTEAEWEKAARGSDARIYPWGNQPADCSRANIMGCSDTPQPVGSHPSGASAFGAEDMAGNVLEWVSDYYDANYYATSPMVDPQGAPSGTRHVQRGGSFMGDAATVRVTNRVSGFPVGLPNVGFRCAVSSK
jgi:eukaryotic-like serine/threonine-protein kinase